MKPAVRASYNPAVPPSPGGLLTDIDAMVALTSPEDSGPGSWADADMLQVCNCKTDALSLARLQTR